MASIQPSLEWNKQVPNTSLCTLPEALVQIPTPLGVVCHRSQYHIADSLYNMVKDNIKLWLEDGTIVEIPANADNSWNNPLALAQMANIQERDLAWILALSTSIFPTTVIAFH
ncbi:hypothetical protein VTP01DRAFT_4938 [Rhizomucor pusillus]|uniref:uncharacterized protein n=1 Tax=Rhizomucor pusillus TaxID=4840 RepID=UPI00374339A2